MGMAYKKNVDDPRESPGFEIMELLLKKGARVEYNDPHIPTLPPMRHYPTLRMASQELTPEYLAKCDAVVVVTDHAAYDWDFVLKHAPLVVDTRNATKGSVAGAAQVVKA
jgi:UDP-N-acetyl-D-glucosamine dehydrogenase